MKTRSILSTLLILLVVVFMSACQPQADAPETNVPLPTGALQEATATPVPPATEIPAATVVPEAPATATPEPTAVPPTEVAQVATSTPLAEAPQAATAIPAAMPILLTIPKLEVSAAIESVGNDTEGRMDVPQEVENAAWWNRGPVPGAPGNAVISGHLDTYLQEPAVFWRLRELVPGDTLSVRDARGVDHTFEVVNSEVYAHDAVPLDVIFGDAVMIRPNLILITCEGSWSESDRNYDQRYVVYAKAVD